MSPRVLLLVTVVLLSALPRSYAGIPQEALDDNATGVKCNVRAIGQGVQILFDDLVNGYGIAPSTTPGLQQFNDFMSKKTFNVSMQQVDTTNYLSDEMLFRHFLFNGISYCNASAFNTTAQYPRPGSVLRSMTGDFKVVSFYPTSGSSLINFYVAVSDSLKTIIVAFRGTKTLFESIYDADSLRSYLDDSWYQYSGKCPFQTHSGAYGYEYDWNAQVYDGFNKLFTQDMAATLKNAVNAAKAANPSYKLVITGHSMGGALAHLAAFYLAMNSYSIDIVYTYSQPLIGYEAAAEWMTECIRSTTSPNIRYVRVISSNDLVPFARWGGDTRPVNTRHDFVASPAIYQNVYAPDMNNIGFFKGCGAKDASCGFDASCNGKEIGFGHVTYGGLRVAAVCDLL